MMIAAVGCELVVGCWFLIVVAASVVGCFV